MSVTTSTTGSAHHHDHDRDYALLMQAVRDTFAATTAGKQVLYRTADTNTFPIFLECLSADQQIHTCHTCKQFFDRYAGLVTLDPEGNMVPVMWYPDWVPAFYRNAVAALRGYVAALSVEGIFLSKPTDSWGTPQTGEWTHFAVVPPVRFTNRDRTKRAGEVMAAKSEDYRTVARALGIFSREHVAEALRILEAGALHRSERFVAPVRWLLDLMDRRESEVDRRKRDNILWHAVGHAPDGYCHPRSSVIGTLIEDIEAGIPFDAAKRRFEEKVAPTRYQRMQVAPTEGNIARAERLFADLGLEPALRRRFARLDEVIGHAIWAPQNVQTDPQPTSTGVFGHLKAKAKGAELATSDMPPVTMTWEKFRREILPKTEAIECWIPATALRVIALTTAAVPDAPPLLAWDRDAVRNPFAWYCYDGGVPASLWGLQPNTWARVNALVPHPTLWGETPTPHRAEGVIVVLDGAKDQQEPNTCLFPEILRDELREVRSTVERHSTGCKMEGREEASACGLDIRRGQPIGFTLRVRSGGAWTKYALDRWD